MAPRNQLAPLIRKYRGDARRILKTLGDKQRELKRLIEGLGADGSISPSQMIAIQAGAHAIKQQAELLSQTTRTAASSAKTVGQMNI